MAAAFLHFRFLGEFNVVDELFNEKSSIGVGDYLGLAGYNYTVAASD